MFAVDHRGPWTSMVLLGGRCSSFLRPRYAMSVPAAVLRTVVTFSPFLTPIRRTEYTQSTEHVAHSSGSSG